MGPFLLVLDYNSASLLTLKKDLRKFLSCINAMVMTSRPCCPSDQSFLFGCRPLFTPYVDHTLQEGERKCVVRIKSKMAVHRQVAKFDPKDRLSRRVAIVLIEFR